MKTKFHYLFLVVCLATVMSLTGKEPAAISSSVTASDTGRSVGAPSTVSPQVFHAALKKLYPQATNVGWSQEGDYYIASFIQNGFDKKVWMSPTARWIMTDTDLETADRLPPMVYNDFIFSQYATWTVTDVNLIKSPRRRSLYVITVNQDNSISTWQLFYASDGSLLHTRDVSYLSPELSPDVFGLP